MLRDKPAVAICEGCWRAWDKLVPEAMVPEGWGSLDAFLTSASLGPNDCHVSHTLCPKCLDALVQASDAARIGYVPPDMPAPRTASAARDLERRSEQR